MSSNPNSPIITFHDKKTSLIKNICYIGFRKSNSLNKQKNKKNNDKILPFSCCSNFKAKKLNEKYQQSQDLKILLKNKINDLKNLNIKDKKWTIKDFSPLITTNTNIKTTSSNSENLLSEKNTFYTRKNRNIEKRIVDNNFKLLNLYEKEKESIHSYNEYIIDDSKLKPSQNYYLLNKLKNNPIFLKNDKNIAVKLKLINKNQSFDLSEKNYYKNKITNLTKIEIQYKLKRKKKSNFIKRNIDLKSIGKRMIDFLMKLKKLKLSLKEVMTNKNIFYENPFERDGSYSFFHEIHDNNYEIITAMLKKMKYFIYDINYNKETALIICCKKNYIKMASLLIQQGSNLEAMDNELNTPLLITLKNENVELLKILLKNRVNPWQTYKFDYRKECKNTHIINLMKIARKLDLVLKMTPAKYRESLWEKEKIKFEEE